MNGWGQYNHLHVVRNLRSMIGKWWNSDLFFLNEEGKFSTSGNEKYFYNPLIASLFKNNSFKVSLSEFLGLQTAQSKETVLLDWEEAGLSLLAVPIFKERRWAGLVGVIGFVRHEDQLKKVQETLHRYNLKGLDISLPVLDTAGSFYMKEIVKFCVQEIVLFHELEKKRQQRLSNYSKSSSYLNSGIIGESSVMKNLYSFLEKLSPSTSNILIQGENGTGKELIAQAIYKNSLRKDEAFIVQNCSAFNDNLLESELFGHVKGAFTGAIQDKKGLFELADKGTFFLDEIGDTSLQMQTKLLRVLQEGAFFPVGSVREKKVDVRVIAATNKDLQKMIQQGAFREDLYYRLNVINIKLPALRERKEDIPLLAEYFLYQLDSTKKKFFDSQVIDCFKSYSWPGNIRELQNEVQRMLILSHTSERISKDFLSDKFIEKKSEEGVFSQSEDLKNAIKDLEKQVIGRCLKEESWNKTRAAKKLGISRAALISKVKTYDLEKKAVN